MSNGNGKSNGHYSLDFTGVWCMIGLAGGLSIIGRFMGSDKRLDGAEITRETIEKALTEEKWIMLDRAFSFALIPGSANGQPMMAPMCMPYGGAHDGDIPVGIQIANITTTLFFDEMPDATRRQFMDYASKGNMAAQKLRAANAGIVTATR